MGEVGNERRSGVTRRRLLATAGVATVGAAAAGAAQRFDAGPGTGTAAADPTDRVPFWGEHQAGIATPQQRHLEFAAFDFTGARSDELRDLLRSWTALAAALAAGRRPAVPPAGADQPPGDTGEAADSPPARLSVTFGLGAGLFERGGDDRLGLRSSMPAGLAPLPAFAGEELDPDLSGGDLCVQFCADDPQVAFHALHVLARSSSGAATLRWSQAGFAGNGGGPRQGTQRNLMGFRDGTNNIKGNDTAELDRHVWTSARDGAEWMAGGTFLVARRIRILFDVWDSTSLREQERAVGRAKASGAPLGARAEHDRVDLAAQGPEGPAIPEDAHVRLASPKTNGGARLLRRGYSFAAGVTPGSGQLDAGLLFISFQRDPRRQFVPIQERLSKDDALARHLLHTGSGLFACPPGAPPGGFVGQTLFAA